MTSLLEKLQSKTGYMTLQEVSEIMGIHDMNSQEMGEIPQDKGGADRRPDQV